MFKLAWSNSDWFFTCFNYKSYSTTSQVGKPSLCRFATTFNVFYLTAEATFWERQTKNIFVITTNICYESLKFLFYLALGWKENFKEKEKKKNLFLKYITTSSWACSFCYWIAWVSWMRRNLRLKVHSSMHALQNLYHKLKNSILKLKAMNEFHTCQCRLFIWSFSLCSGYL